MDVYIASDHTGVELKKILIVRLLQHGIRVFDLGCDSGSESVDYPDYAYTMSSRIVHSTNAFGILICGTGIGMSIAANRNNKIRASLCCSEAMAKLAREHNDANVICLGARFIEPDEAVRMVMTFLSSTFMSGRHTIRVHKLTNAVINE